MSVCGSWTECGWGGGGGPVHDELFGYTRCLSRECVRKRKFECMLNCPPCERCLSREAVRQWKFDCMSFVARTIMNCLLYERSMSVQGKCQADLQLYVAGGP